LLKQVSAIKCLCADMHTHFLSNSKNMSGLQPFDLSNIYKKIDNYICFIGTHSSLSIVILFRKRTMFSTLKLAAPVNFPRR
jgi:hypothetical protein